MPEFLAETYTAPEALSSAALRVGELAQAAGPAAPARFLGAIAVPAEETCLYLCQAPTAAAVRAAMAAAGLRPERITPAVTIRPPSPPGPAAARARSAHHPHQDLANGGKTHAITHQDSRPRGSLIGAAALHRSRSALARACLAVGVLAAAAAKIAMRGLIRRRLLAGSAAVVLMVGVAGGASASEAAVLAGRASAGGGQCSAGRR